ncbi:ABC transporter substrate-binding protein [Nocardia bovistercoris]|uniref:ABC transporter substrate-binding protein n=1 Tax=Nocardia bovistercoris TaxID=2785916 RepID=A0A931IA89_9NOCA|nr:ABC transporter substrate-binding protein [Nocardia bovistercoris]MBH0777624.1 ABC transporter substrate-binding protein [Nocardia bovistercoris]
MKPARPRRSFTRATITALAGALAFAITGCGSPDNTAPTTDSIVIPHARGETTLNSTPQRIVTLGNQWLDTALALDTVPVGYLDNVAIAAKGKPPWQPDKLASSTSLDSIANISEQVAALEPDLILVDPFIADQKTYDDLSRVAPTVPGLTRDSVGKWQDQVTTLGKILGKQDSAAAVIASVDGKIAGIVAANPGLKGKTFASTWFGSPAQVMVLTDPADGSSRVFAELGMSIPKNLTEQPSSGGRLALSTERLNEVTADLLLAGYSPGYEEKYRQLPGYADLPAVKNNAVVFLTTLDITAVNQPTPLSVPYILDKLNPALVAIAE